VDEQNLRGQHASELPAPDGDIRTSGNARALPGAPHSTDLAIGAGHRQEPRYHGGIGMLTALAGCDVRRR